MPAAPAGWLAGWLGQHNQFCTATMPSWPAGSPLQTRARHCAGLCVFWPLTARHNEVTTGLLAVCELALKDVMHVWTIQSLIIIMLMDNKPGAPSLFVIL